MNQPNRYLEARKKLSLKQIEVAEKVGLEQSIISKVENGKAQKLYDELVDFYVSKGIDKEWLLETFDSEESEWKTKYEESQKEVSSLKDELLQVRRELSEIKDRFIAFQELAFQKMNGIEMGKPNASRSLAILPNKKVASLLA